MRRILFLGLILSLLASSMAFCADPARPLKTTDVMARGMADGTDTAARGRAVQQALEKAFRRTCEPLLPGRSDDPAYEAYRKRALGQWKQYIAGHVIRRAFAGEGKTYVQLVVKVKREKFRRDWGDQTPLAKKEAPPQVLLVVLRDPPPRDGRRQPLEPAPSAQRLFLKVMDRKGLPAVNRSLGADAYEQQLVPLALEAQPDRLVALAGESQADLLVCVVLRPRGQANDEVDHDTYRCSGRAMIIHPASGKVLAAPSFGPTPVRVASGGASHVLATASFARRTAPQTAQAIAQAWAKRPRPAEDVELIIDGLDDKAWPALARQLQGLHGVEEVTLKTHSGQEATAVVTCRTTPQALAAATAGVRSPRLRVSRVGDERVYLKVLR